MAEIEEGYCRWLSHFFFIAGYEAEDIYQEAVIAMWLAPEVGLRRVCAYRRVVELLRRSKRRPIFCVLHDDEAKTDDLIEMVAGRERLRLVLSTNLSDLERIALGRSLRGESCGERHLDNARQRALEKVAKRLAA